MLFDGQEAHGYAIGAGSRQLDALFSAIARKEGMGNLNEDAGTIAGFRVAPARAAMGEVDQDLDALADDLMAFFAADAGDKAHSAGIMLITRVIKTLGLGNATMTGFRLHGSLSMKEFRINRLKTLARRRFQKVKSPDWIKGLP